MAHTGPRTNATPLRYHIGVLNQLFTLDAGAWTFHPDLVTPAIAADVGDLVGGLNANDRAQWPGIPFPSGPDAPNPGTPGMPTTDDEWLAEWNKAMDNTQPGGARPDLAWFQISTGEQAALMRQGMYTQQQINVEINKYNGGATPDGWPTSSIRAFRAGVPH